MTTTVRLRICCVPECRRRIKDDESCWRDNAGRYVCNDCKREGRAR